jgi:hypothetical protein
MAKDARKLVGAAAVAILMVHASATADAEPIVVVVDVDNRSGIRAEALKEAVTHATQIYAAIGVALVWTDGGRIPGEPAALRLAVALISGSGEERLVTEVGAPTGTLGFAPRGTGRAYILCGRVARLAKSTGEPVGAVLGRVIAHEIGHLLMPGQGHSQTGIMRARLDDWPSRMPAFSDAEAEAIRGLANRQ